MAHIGISDNVPGSVASNYQQARIDRRDGKTLVSSYPLYVYLCVGSLCNMVPRCKMCLTPHTGNFMSEELLGKVTREVLPHALNVRLTVDGEPTIYPGIVEVINNIEGWASLQTNGLDDSKYPEIIPQLHNLFFSVDATTSATYKAIRGDHFEKVINHIEKAVSIRNSLPYKNPFIRMDFVLMQRNKHELIDFVKLAHNLGVNGIYVSPLFPLVKYPKYFNDDGSISFDYESELVSREESKFLLDEVYIIAQSLGLKAEGHYFQ